MRSAACGRWNWIEKQPDRRADVIALSVRRAVYLLNTRRLMIIVSDSLSDLVRKGEITPRVYNSGN